MNSTPHQKICFYHLPTRGRAGVKLGGADMSTMYLQLFIVPWCYIINLGCFIIILYHFLVLTYWHSAKCQLLFSACFLQRRKSISNGVQMPRNFMEIFYGPKGRQWALVVPRGCPEGGTTHQGAPGPQVRPGGLCPPRWPPVPPLHPTNAQIFQKPSGDPRSEVPPSQASVSTKTNLDPVPAPCRRGRSSPVAIFIIPAATTMRRE